MSEFEYSNLSARPPGPFVSVASRVLRGVGRVQAQRVPFAEAWQQANAAALADDSRPLWVAIGDSMTQGIGAPSPEQGWVGQLGRQLAAAGRPHRVVNLSTTGARTDDVLDRQLPALEQLGALGHVPALVTVLIGSNDMMRRDSRDGLAQRYAQILRRLPEGAVLATLPGGSPAVLEVNRLIQQAVRERGMRLADMRRHGSWRGKLADDHFHPNAHGYADMAATFAHAVLGGDALDEQDRATA